MKSLIHGLRGMRLAAAGALVCLATMAAAASPDFGIVSPEPGTTVKSPVVLRTTVVDAELGSPRDGLYHLHYSVDGGEEVALYRKHDVSIALRPGMHVITVELAGPNHRAVRAPKKVAFMVNE
ncbi:MAG: hypothetical protein WBF97_09605 [Comamonas sp.]